MKLIVGLGNPGKAYENTRHNVGFWVIEEVSRRWNIPLTKNKWDALVGDGLFGNEKVVLLQPQTYMNRSGQAVRAAMDWLKIDLEDLLVIYDDVDLPPGKIRLRLKGNSGGHNGVKSIISHLGTNEWKRIKIGVGKPEGLIPVADYVLSSFAKSEEQTIQEAVKNAADATDDWIRSDFVTAMNRYN